MPTSSPAFFADRMPRCWSCCHTVIGVHFMPDARLNITCNITT
ncbi:hypothetical protein [Streptomyces longwoodensis]